MLSPTDALAVVSVSIMKLIEPKLNNTQLIRIPRSGECDVGREANLDQLLLRELLARDLCDHSEVSVSILKLI